MSEESPRPPLGCQSIQSEAIAELVKALSVAQGQLQGAKRESENDFFKSAYADLASDWDACRGPLSRNGLAVFQVVAQLDGKSVLITTLGHSSGQWVRSYYPILPVKNDPQGVKSAITYARRTALEAIVGISTVDDDDGEAAQGRARTPDPVSTGERGEPWQEPLKRAQSISQGQQAAGKAAPVPAPRRAPVPARDPLLDPLK